jgi:hypothetical protein
MSTQFVDELALSARTRSLAACFKSSGGYLIAATAASKRDSLGPVVGIFRDYLSVFPNIDGSSVHACNLPGGACRASQTTTHAGRKAFGSFG